MGVLGARPGDLVDCLLGGDPEACERVYTGYYLWPRVQRLLEEFELPPPSPPPVRLPRPQPDPVPSLLRELVPLLLAPYLGEPNPEPNLPPEVRLQTTIKFRDRLQGLVKELDEEIRELEEPATTKG